MALREMAQALGGKLHGSDVEFTGVSTDTRLIRNGELFVAIQGPNYDGHLFLPEAENKRAAAALVCRTVSSGLPQVSVRDTRLGLGTLAGYWRNKFDCPIVAVTGSNGKTTVKEMIGNILRSTGTILVSRGNLNNDIGLPLVLCGLREEHDCAVVELGMNHAGEIDYLSRLARPRVAVITNAAPAHLEGLGTVDAVVQAKAEIFAGLTPEGVAVINADDAFADTWRRRVRNHECITFGIEQSADITADQLNVTSLASSFSLNTPLGDCDVTLPLPGRHNVMNALASTAAAIAMGADLDHIRRGLGAAAPVSGRLKTRSGYNGSTVIDDSYNANPISMLVAIQVLAASPGLKTLVIGDMKELGDEAETLHTEVGRQARQAGIDHLLTFGMLSRCAALGFGKGVRQFDNKTELIESLKRDLDTNTTVLIKGSRGMHMEEVVQAITVNEVMH